MTNNCARKCLTAILAAALLAAGCGKGDSSSPVTTVGELGAALAESAEVTTYRISMWAAQTIELPFAGIDSAAEIDEQAPLMVAEVIPDRQHHVLDLSSLLGQASGEDFDIKFEIWSSDERLVIDTRDYQQLLDLAPDIQLGPFEPGISFVDLTELGASSPELLAAVAGSSVPDLKELAEKLPAALIDVEQTDSDPLTYTGTITFFDLTLAQGQDADTAARGAAAGLALNSSMDGNALAEFYIDFYRSTEAEVTIELDDRGLLRVLSTRVDLSDLYSELFEVEGLLPDVTDSELQEAREDVKDAVHILETRALFEADDDLEVPLPPATTDDRTELWAELLGNAGFG